VTDTRRELETLEFEAPMEESVSPGYDRSSVHRYYESRNLEHIKARRKHHLQLSRVHNGLSEQNMIQADRCEEELRRRGAQGR